MGCNSSAPASEPGSRGGSGNKRLISGTVEYIYFDGLRGRADPLRQMFEYVGQPCNKKGYAPPDWEAAKARGEGGEFGGGMPQVFFTENGKKVRLAQFSAIIRTLGIRYGLYNPKDWKQARYIDPVIDTWADFQGAGAGVLFAPNEEAKAAGVVKYEAVMDKFFRMLDKTMQHHGGKYIAGNSVTIADFIVACLVGTYCLNEACPVAGVGKKLIQKYPTLHGYAKRIQAGQDFPFATKRTDVAPF